MTWGYATEAGDPVACSDRRVVEVEVSLGGEPISVPCGDIESVTFDDLLPGRYPVVITALGSGGIRRYEHVSNVVAEGGRTVGYAHEFTVDTNAFGVGRIALGWTIDSVQASLACIDKGAVTARARISEGPGPDAELTVPCTAGQVAFENVQQGTYLVRLDLLDQAGDAATVPALDNSVLVVQNETTDVYLDVVGPNSPKGSIEARWALNGVPAPEGCEQIAALNEVEVAVRSDEAQGLTIATATTTCDAASLVLEGLPVGRSVDGIGLRVTYRLFDTTVARQFLDTAVVRNVVIPGPTTTATVAADFEVQ